MHSSCIFRVTKMRTFQNLSTNRMLLRHITPQRQMEHLKQRPKPIRLKTPFKKSKYIGSSTSQKGGHHNKKQKEFFLKLLNYNIE